MHIWKLFQVQQPLLAPDGAGGGGDSGSGGGEISEYQSDMDILNEGDGDEGDDTETDSGDEDDGTGETSDDGEGKKTRKEPKPHGRPKVAAEGEDEQEDEDDDEDEEEDTDDETEDETDEDKGKRLRVVGRPTLEQIKKYDKNLFKYLPGMRDVYFSEAKFRELFADPEQAAEASEKATHFDALSSSLEAGSAKVLLNELREGNAAAFTKVVESFLPTLRGLDEQTYLKVTQPILRELFFHAYNYGKQRGGENGKNIMMSAEWLSDFVFANGGKIEPISTNGAEKHPAEIELEKERARSAQEKHTAALGDVNTKIEASLVSFINGLIPSSANKFIRGSIVSAALDELIAGIPKDKPFTVKLTGLWNRARIAQYSETHKRQIIDAHLTRGKGVARETVNRLLKEAGIERKKRVQGEGEGEETHDRNRGQDSKNTDRDTRKARFESQGRRPSGSARRESVLDSSKIDYSKTSDADILSGDRHRIKLKRD